MTDTLCEPLASRGVTRRSFLAFCGTVAAAIGIEGITEVEVAQAIEEKLLIGAAEGKLLPVIWMELGSCTGCTESFAQADDPDPATIIMEYISLNYAETLCAAAGYSLEEAREETVEHAAGKYVLVIEGAVMTGCDGYSLTVGDDESTHKPTAVCTADGPLARAAKNAAAVISAGSCAVDGGFVAAYPNPMGAMGMQKWMKDNGIDTPCVNVPSCPVNPARLVAVIVEFILTGKLPALNDFNMPSAFYDQTIHDNCPRRGHFENGEFVYKFGSKEESLGYCLYPLGCKGPQTKANCAQVRWNRRVSWCIDSGSPCIGCSCADPTTTSYNWFDSNTPVLGRLKTVRLGDLRMNVTPIALGITGIVAAALVVHGFGFKLTGRTDGGADFEPAKEWDIKHGRVTPEEVAAAKTKMSADEKPAEEE